MLAGPILLYRGVTPQGLRLSVTVVVAEDATPPALTAEGGTGSAPRRLGGRLGSTVWGYELVFPRAAAEREVAYRLDGARHPVVLAGEGGSVRLAYTACNGSEGEGLKVDDMARRNALWSALGRHHAESPRHLLLQGGDQLYADALWKEVPALAAWRRRPRPVRIAVPADEAMREAIADYYYERYCRLWSMPQIASVVASIPSVMMWDDHDIVDGWGSQRSDKQDCPVFQAVWAAAREAFALFQLGARPEALPDGFGDPGGGHLGWSGRLGPLGIVAPDLRSERRLERVMGAAGWRWLERTLAGMGDCRRLLLMLSVPLVNLDLSWLERLFRLVPGEPSYQDDLRDQWMSHAHRDEWRRMASSLCGFTRDTGVPVTIVSGEIHLAAHGRLEGEGVAVDQLISSGIAHPAPPRGFARALGWLAHGVRHPAPGFATRMLKLPGTNRRYLGARNWLDLEVSADGALAAAWHHDGAEETPIVRRARSRGGEPAQ